MQIIKVKRQDVLKVLKENLEIHIQEVKEAKAGYREVVIGKLAQLLGQVKNGGKIETRIDCPEPRDYSDDYEQAIGVFEWSVDDVIEVSQQEFNCYVLDKWSWKAAYDVSNMGYTNLKVK